MFDLKSLTLEELKNLEAEVKKEIASRQEKPELVLYTHQCKDKAKHHLNKYKHWAKLVSSIDTTKTNGYAFIGDFLNVAAEHKVPVGSIVVEVCDTTITAFEMSASGAVEIGSAKTTAMSGLIEALAERF